MTAKKGVSNLPRREFLVVMWGVMTALAATLAGWIGIWHMMPDDKDNAEGGVFLLSKAPEIGASPMEVPIGKFAWIRDDLGVAAISEICPHMGCVLAWQVQTGRFQCPCHGSEFDKMGGVVHGPADHPLDYLQVMALDADGKVVDKSASDRPWVEVKPNYHYLVNTDKRIAANHSGAVQS